MVSNHDQVQEVDAFPRDMDHSSDFSKSQENSLLIF